MNFGFPPTSMIQHRWRQLQSNSLPVLKPEDSILFRVLTQSLVSVGILATDIAAETHISVWAIPLSTAGAAWSWYGRRKRNIPTKVVLAIAMLGVLAAFFSRLLSNGQLNDTRLVLAEFLIEIQVLHSFDLPRRKDLGYSMIIGLVLLGVASTLSQTMLFGVMLLVFLAIALPVLMLDYRSRLGLSSAKAEQAMLRKFIPTLTKMFLVILLLGLVSFAVMPRFSQYHLRSLPMSAPFQLPEKFAHEQVASPRYIRGGKDKGGGDGLFSQSWRGLLVSLVLAAGFGGCGWLILQGWQKWRDRRRLKQLPPMENLYQEMLNWQAKQGFHKHPAQTPLEYAQQFHSHSKAHAQTIQEISNAYVGWRYGGQNPDVQDLQQRLRELRKSDQTR